MSDLEDRLSAREIQRQADVNREAMASLEREQKRKQMKADRLALAVVGFSGAVSGGWFGRTAVAARILMLTAAPVVALIGLVFAFGI